MREFIIGELGVDYLYELDFNNLSKLTADEYLNDILFNTFHPSSISVGWNHNFGFNKCGNVGLLREKSKDYGYDLFEIVPQKLNNDIISSSKIRKYLTDGAIQTANLMLGYDFFISGVVVQGQKLGRTIGFRTANINYPDELINLPYGVYETEITYNNHIYKSISNYGMRPTVNGSSAILEVHILDFDRDIYGETLIVRFKKLIRKEKKFNNLEELRLQIKADITKIL